MISLIVAGLASVLLIAFMLASGHSGSLDHPNKRSLHSQPVPRSGGLGVMLATAIGMFGASVSLWLATAVAMIALVSWLDDQKDLPILARFTSHFIAASIVVWNGGLPGWGAGATVVALFAVVWVTNLYNFMDGSDGLAGGMTLFGFGAFGTAASVAGAMDMALLAGCIAAGAAGFLLFNFHPARIFLGDVGSIPLGFLAAVLGMDGVRRELWPLWFPLLVFSPFIVDASVTLTRRLLRHERIWQAHREHYYQRLIRMGFGHRKTALLEYAAMIASGGTGVVILHAEPVVQGAALAICGAVYLALIGWIEFRWRRFEAVAPTISGK